MQAAPLTGTAAKTATLEHKLAIATLRARHGATKAQRESEALAAERYARELSAMQEVR